MNTVKILVGTLLSILVLVAPDIAFAQSGAKTPEKLAITICSNNGVGNGGERITQVAALGESQRNNKSPNEISYECEKFLNIVEDLPGQPGQISSDPN